MGDRADCTPDCANCMLVGHPLISGDKHRLVASQRQLQHFLWVVTSHASRNSLAYRSDTSSSHNTPLSVSERSQFPANCLRQFIQIDEDLTGGVHCGAHSSRWIATSI